MNTKDHSYGYTIQQTDVLIRDGAVLEEDSDKFEVLERYYNDIYKLFISKITLFDKSSSISYEDTDKLKKLLNEIIYIKGLLQELK